MDKTKERNSHGAESQGGYRRRTLALEATGIIYFYDKVAKRYGRLTYRYVYLKLWLGEESVQVSVFSRVRRPRPSE